MSQFPDFKKTHGPPVKCRKPAPEDIQGYTGKLPAAVIGEWREDGWCGYGDGLVWFVNPAEFKDVLEDWLGPSDPALAFLRNAFGDMVVWSDTGTRYVDVLHDKVFDLSNDVETLIDFMFCDKSYLQNVLNAKLFKKAKQKLGPLDADECYGFEPAIALGGPGTLDTLKKVKLIPYLAILAQITGK